MRGRLVGATLRVSLVVMVVALLTAGTAFAGDYNLYFGDLHAHTDYSDGTGTPTDAFAAAKAAGADFFATTDHNHYGYGPVWMTADRWAEELAVADSFNEDGKFVALAGYELWLPWVGELNIYNTDEMFGQNINPAGHGYNNGLHDGAVKVLPNLYDWLAANEGVAQWNHPGYYGGAKSTIQHWFDFGYYTPVRDQAISMIEVWNEITYEDAYIEALDKGWHVLPTANSDTHSADWISGCDVRTVLLAGDLTRAGLFGAMRASRGYATEDKNLEIRYELDGQVMGSTLASKTSHEASIQIHDPDGMTDAIKHVEIVSDGGAVVESEAFDSADVTWTPTLSSSTARYYYVRVTTASDFWGAEGVTAWTAPVWIGR